MLFRSAILLEESGLFKFMMNAGQCASPNLRFRPSPPSLCVIVAYGKNRSPRILNSAFSREVPLAAFFCNSATLDLRIRPEEYLVMIDPEPIEDPNAKRRLHPTTEAAPDRFGAPVSQRIARLIEGGTQVNGPPTVGLLTTQQLRYCRKRDHKQRTPLGFQLTKE